MADNFEELGADKPAPDYEPMGDPYRPEREQQKTYSNEPDDLREAAAEVDQLRSDSDAAESEEPLPLERKYYRTEDGRFTGQAAADHETISAERASEDLTRQRDAEVGAEQQQIADAVKIVHAVNVAEVHPQQQQPVEAQQPQPQDEQAEFERALANPKLRAALEQEVGKLEASRSQYATAAAQALELSAAACYASFPELNGITATTLPAVINVLQQTNPARADAMRQALTATERLYRTSQQAQAAQSEIARARQVVWTRGEDSKFEAAIANEPAEVVHEVTREGMRILRESYGITSEGLSQLVNANPGLRSAEAQRLLFDTIKSRLAAEKIAAKKVVAVPPVMRPGVSAPRASYSDEEASSALREFKSSPSPESAAKYLAARRAAKQQR